jgi:drug/metabolite transporter (DMT)-like permease
MAIVGGANYVVAKNVVPVFIGPSGMIVIRVFTGTLFFMVLDAFSKDKKAIAKADYWKIVACAFAGVVVNQLFFFNGLAITSPINASLMMLVSPIVIMLFAFIILKEKLVWYNVVGIVIGIIGAIILILARGKVGLDTSNRLGDFFIFINAISWGFYVILAAPLMQKYNPFTLLKWTFGIGFIFVLPFGYQQLLSIDLNAFTPKAWFGFWYVLLLATYLAYYIHTAVLKYISPSISGTYVYFQPIVATIITIVFGLDSLNSIKVLSALMIFLGVYLVGKRNT